MERVLQPRPRPRLGHVVILAALLELRRDLHALQAVLRLRRAAARAYRLGLAHVRELLQPLLGVLDPHDLCKARVLVLIDQQLGGGVPHAAQALDDVVDETVVEHRLGQLQMPKVPQRRALHK